MPADGTPMLAGRGRRAHLLQALRASEVGDAQLERGAARVAAAVRALEQKVGGLHVRVADALRMALAQDAQDVVRRARGLGLRHVPVVLIRTRTPHTVQMHAAQTHTMRRTREKNKEKYPWSVKQGP